MGVYESFSSLVGKTPILKLNNFSKQNDFCAFVFAKLEYFNPGGSVKDRVAVKMLDDAEKSGALKKGGTVIEATSGNTGIGLCAVCAERGYKAIIVMPENMSDERKKLMRAYGAELVLTGAELGMKGAVDRAKEILAATENAFLASQFENESNYKAHESTTGPEIYKDLEGKVDILVAGIGTGGTITGTAKFLRNKIKDIKIVGVEPFESPFLTKGEKGAHQIQGIGAGFKPSVLDKSVLDEIVTVKGSDAIKCAQDVCKSEGILVGISSGAALFAAMNLAKMKENEGKNIVVILPDTGERYLSTALFN